MLFLKAFLAKANKLLNIQKKLSTVKNAVVQKSNVVISLAPCATRLLRYLSCRT
jgi:hypothetical protein